MDIRGALLGDLTEEDQRDVPVVASRQARVDALTRGDRDLQVLQPPLQVITPVGGYAATNNLIPAP